MFLPILCLLWTKKHGTERVNESLSLLMLCMSSNCRRPFSIICFLVKIFGINSENCSLHLNLSITLVDQIYCSTVQLLFSAD